MLQKCVLKGCSFFQGEVEGKSHDTGILYIEEPFDSGNANAKGFRTVDYKCEDSAIPRSLMDKDFPLTAEVDLAIVATKKAKEIVVKSVKLLGQAAPQPRAA